MNMSSKGKVVIRRCLEHIGDVAIMLRSVELLRLQCPHLFIGVQCSCPDLLKGHPAIDCIMGRDDTLTPADAMVDLDYVKYDSVKVKHELFCEELSRQLGIDIQWDGRPQTLWVSDERSRWANAVVKNAAKEQIPIGIFWRASEANRTWYKMPRLVKMLTKSECAVFCFDGEERLSCDSPNVHQFVGYSLDKVCALISRMRLIVTLDSAGLHIAGGLGVPVLTIFGTTDPLLLASMYEDSHWITVPCSKQPCWPEPCKWRPCLRKVKVLDVYDKIESILLPERPPSRRCRKNNGIALLRLDGFGGTLTLSDQALKVKRKWDEKVTLIVRHHSEIFRDNPHVDDIIQVGYVKWEDTLEEYKDRFAALADIRFAVPRWYGRRFQSFTKWRFYYDEFPLYQGRLGELGLHHIQLTDNILGLPYDTIDTSVYFDISEDDPVQDLLPEDKYIVITNGVDTIHRGLIQTKCWPHWNDLVRIGIEEGHPRLVQVGTQFDPLVRDAIDLRGKTDLAQLALVLKKAHGIIVTEGGIMHLAYALQCDNVFILRGATVSPLLEYPGHHFIDSYICKGCLFETKDWFEKCPRKMVEPSCMRSIPPERVWVNYENLAKD